MELTTEKLQEILNYIAEEHNDALQKYYETDNDYFKGRAYAYGDVRCILASWLNQKDLFFQFILERESCI